MITNAIDWINASDNITQRVQMELAIVIRLINSRRPLGCRIVVDKSITI